MTARGLTALTFVLLAAACAFLLFERPLPLAPSTLDVAPGEATRPSVVDGPLAAPEMAAQGTQQSAPQIDRTQARSVTQVTREGEWSILVVDPSRRPITGARVDLVEVRPASEVKSARRRVRSRGSERSGTDGIARFPLPKKADRFGIVVSADGWLRTATSPPVPLLDDPSIPLVIVLQRGSRLQGRVVDQRGRPVPNLTLLAHSAGYGVDHVCLSSVGLRAQQKFRDPRNARYQQCQATTAADGSIAFDEIPPRSKMVVRSNNPAWHIVGSETGEGDARLITWTAAPSFGVVVRVLDTARRHVLAAGTFCVDLDLTDGSRQKLGQWVGRGNGCLLFSCTEDLLPQRDGINVAQAVFYGTVTTSAGTESWRAPPILNPKRGGVSELEVLVSANARADEAPLNSVPTIPLVLDVLDGDGQPYAASLLVGWSSSTRAGNPQGNVDAEMVRPGVYRAEVPVPGDIEELEILVQRGNASTSLPTWTTTLPAIPERQKSLSVRLPPAGDVVILRPRRWTAAWTVRASYRTSPKDPWQGSRTFETRDDRLTLRSLLPAQWRLELVQDASARPTTLQATVRAGDLVVVGG